MKYCQRCVLPDNFPGISFNDQGVCNFCLGFKGEENLEEKKKEYKQKFLMLVNEFKGKSGYDAIMSYSGGKDSSYVLSLMKENYGLNILAFTVDNGFIPEQTFTNMRRVTEKLGLDHIILKPRFDMLKRIFSTCANENIYPQATLVRASTICTACMAIVKFSCLRTAVEKNIPLVVYGWSPGQIPLSSSIMKNNSQMVKLMQKNILEPLYKIAGEQIKPYFLEDRHFDTSLVFPYNVSPLCFIDYDEEVILKKVTGLGWQRPQGLDSNSTNCLLNTYANITHKKQHGFHPYAFEMAKLVREGYMDRASALKKLGQKESPRTYDFVRKRLRTD